MMATAWRRKRKTSLEERQGARFVVDAGKRCFSARAHVVGGPPFSGGLLVASRTAFMFLERPFASFQFASASAP